MEEINKNISAKLKGLRAEKGYSLEEMAEKIATTQMVSLSKMLNDKKVSLTYDKSVIDYIVKKGYSKEYGARNIKRIIDNNIKIKLGKEILFGNLQNGGNCNLSFVDDELRISN